MTWRDYRRRSDRRGVAGRGRRRRSRPAITQGARHRRHAGDLQKVAAAAAVARPEARGRAPRGPAGDEVLNESALGPGPFDGPPARCRVTREEVVGVPTQRLVGPHVASDTSGTPASRAPHICVPAALEGDRAQGSDDDPGPARHPGGHNVQVVHGRRWTLAIFPDRRGWQCGQECVPRPPTTTRVIAVPQTRQGSPPRW